MTRTRLHDMLPDELSDAVDAALDRFGVPRCIRSRMRHREALKGVAKTAAVVLRYIEATPEQVEDVDGLWPGVRDLHDALSWHDMLGMLLRGMRRKAGLTVEGLVEAIGKQYPAAPGWWLNVADYIAAIEAGTATITLTWLHLWCSACGVPQAPWDLDVMQRRCNLERTDGAVPAIAMDADIMRRYPEDIVYRDVAREGVGRFVVISRLRAYGYTATGHGGSAVWRLL